MKYVIPATLALAALLSSQLAPAKPPVSKPRYQDDSFRRKEKKTATLWASIPFFEGGDLGQYSDTMSKTRDEVRKMFWKELMDEVQKLADKGVAVEAMLEPMANILLAFDQVHDKHKAIDAIKIDQSLEARFKAAFDRLYSRHDIRDQERKLQIGKGTRPDLLESYVRKISKNRPLGGKITRAELDVKKMLEIYDEIDYVAYGTFSSLGRGSFQVTLHLESHKNQVSRSFMAQGSLTGALDEVAAQVFDYFQKNEYPDWENPAPGLTWKPMPRNSAKLEDGYTFSEAQRYCSSQGYRLPYHAELVNSESGGGYKTGGIDSLVYGRLYAVADRREATGNYFVRVGSEEATGGPFLLDSDGGLKGHFWCVRGEPSPEVKFQQQLMTLFRKYRSKNADVFLAVETLRFFSQDPGANASYFYSESPGAAPRMLKVLDSADEALEILRAHGIDLVVPESVRSKLQE